jgi:chaperonin GroEL (HSP60 family)
LKLKAERSLNDAISVASKIKESKFYSYGGGSLEMELAARLKKSTHIDKCVLKCFSNALEQMVNTISDNCNLNTKTLISQLKQIHSSSSKESSEFRFGIDILNNKVEDMKKLKIVEPSLVKKNVISLATECACNILEIDFVVVMPQEESERERSKRISEELKQRKYAEKKWKEFQNSLQKKI